MSKLWESIPVIFSQVGMLKAVHLSVKLTDHTPDGNHHQDEGTARAQMLSNPLNFLGPFCLICTKVLALPWMVVHA